MKITKIYFDMDGVLADFDRGIRELCNIEPLDQAHKTEVDDDKMWAAIKNVGHFYDNLEIMPGAKHMYNVIYNRYPGSCEILSGIPKSRRGIETAGEDKEKWAHRLIDRNINVNIVYREEKKNYVTGRDCILIDDLEKNIKEWETCGGTGILYKSPEETLQRLKEIETNLGGNRILSTPYAGWAEFMLGSVDYDLSYICDVAGTWLARATDGLKCNESFILDGDGEGKILEVEVFLDHVDILIDPYEKREVTETIEMSMLDFCKLLHDDIRRDVKEWADWEWNFIGLSEEDNAKWLVEKENRLIGLLEELNEEIQSRLLG